MFEIIEIRLRVFDPNFGLNEEFYFGLVSFLTFL